MTENIISLAYHITKIVKLNEDLDNISIDCIVYIYNSAE